MSGHIFVMNKINFTASGKPRKKKEREQYKFLTYKSKQKIHADIKCQYTLQRGNKERRHRSHVKTAAQ